MRVIRKYILLRRVEDLSPVPHDLNMAEPGHQG